MAADRLLTLDLLAKVCPLAPRARLQAALVAMLPAFAEAAIDTWPRVAMAVAHLAHESTEFSRFVENLNYSATAIMETWPGRLPSLVAAGLYARNPERLANKVYADRLGNGSEESGDGWRYRGRGPLQHTGRKAYAALSAVLGVDLVKQPELLERLDLGFRAFAWFWTQNNLNAAADALNVKASTRIINGPGMKGLASREMYFARARAALETLL
jgi:putative chitinase